MIKISARYKAASVCKYYRLRSGINPRTSAKAKKNGGLKAATFLRIWQNLFAIGFVIRRSRNNNDASGCSQGHDSDYNSSCTHKFACLL